MLKSFIIVGLGSFLGGGFRFLLSKLIQLCVPHPFPAGTLLVNVLGCFLIGVFYALFEKGSLLNPELRLFLTVGLCGGFTTFSTFMNETVQLFKSAQLVYLSMYAGFSLIGGIVAIYAGHAFVKYLGTL